MTDGVPVVLHADVGGVQFTPFGQFVETNTIVAAFEETRCTVTCVGHAVSMVGLSYDYAGLFAKGVWFAAEWLGLRMRYPLRSPRSVVCSEFVARSVPAFAAYDPERVTPQDLLDHCRNDDTFTAYELPRR